MRTLTIPPIIADVAAIQNPFFDKESRNFLCLTQNMMLGKGAAGYGLLFTCQR
jgi:hypothetical protein